MATGSPTFTGATSFPNGVAQYTFIAKGTSASNLGVTGVLSARDRLMQVVAITLSGVLVKDSGDYTNEYTIKSNDYLNNTGGTSTAGKIVFVTVARKSA